MGSSNKVDALAAAALDVVMVDSQVRTNTRTLPTWLTWHLLPTSLTSQP